MGYVDVTIIIVPSNFLLNVTISDCTSLKTTWTNMKASKQFPVSSGTVLSLNCNVGYELKGDETVTCIQIKQFQYSAEPTCGEKFTEKYYVALKTSTI